MALLGGDWGPYTLSFGSFFPSIGLRSGTVYREILSNRVAYAIRAMITTNNWRFRIIGAPIHFDGNKPTQTQLATDMNSTVSSFSFDGSYARGGVDFQYSTFKFSGDLLLNQGSYNEVNLSVPATHSYANQTISLTIKDELESTVTITAVLNLDQFKTTSSLSGANIDNTFNGLRYGGSIEFLF